MKTTRRRQRKFDALATTAGVRSLLQKLYLELPGCLPEDEHQLISLLNAVRHAERRRPAKSKRGRPSPWAPGLLQKVTQALRAVLARETQERLSLQTFVSQHLPLLAYPDELAAALHAGAINKQEALTLARLTAEKLQTTESAAQQLRMEVLRSHLEARASQNQLRERVKELLGESAVISRETLALGVLKNDALLYVSPDDVRHVFFETIKELFYAIRQLPPAELDETDIEDFLHAADLLANKIHRIEQRLAQRKASSKPTTKDQPPAESVDIVIDEQTGHLIYKFD
jgi:hypothetical protein